VALAYVKREYRVVGKTLAVTIGGKPYQVEVTLLPLISPPSSAQRARQLYEEALDCFAREKDDDEASHAESLLREALLLEPTLEDAYEALGVILSRRNRLDEAVSLMKALVELNADSVMAHANLSVFYMQQELIEQAEEEKAISMSIRMRMAAREATKERQQEEESKRLKEEATERMDMFRQVLEIDSEDLLALSGMGNCLVTLAEFEKALPYLQKAIAVKPTHTVAYVDLARAFAGLNQKSKAAQTLEKGIEVASKRGDMMPLKQMQAQLKELT
jgi:tetratricopeptide (TPR) repeat protein